MRIATVPSSVPVIRRCHVALVGRVRTNLAMDPAATMMSRFTVMLTGDLHGAEREALEDSVAPGGVDELRDEREVHDRRLGVE